MALNTFISIIISRTLGKCAMDKDRESIVIDVVTCRFEGNPWVAKAFATIPSVNMWDDHVSRHPSCIRKRNTQRDDD